VRRGAIGLVVVLCASRASADDLGTSASAILDATPSSRAAVVQVLRTFPGGYALSSGALVAANVVLTARHVIAPVTSGKSVCESTFGESYDLDDLTVATGDAVGPTSETFTIAEIHVPETHGFCGSDLALLILDRTTSAAPIAPRLASPPRSGETFTAISYGPMSLTDMQPPRRRERAGVAVGCLDGATCPAPYEFDSAAVGCRGDNGAAAIATDGTLIGVFSGGDPECLRVNTWTRIDAHAAWVQPAAVRAASLGGYAAPGWATEQVTPPHAEPHAETSEGCGCTTPRTTSPSGRLFVLLAMFAALRRRMHSRPSKNRQFETSAGGAALQACLGSRDAT
jgi:MYXO-CTERM domain-containing protein